MSGADGLSHRFGQNLRRVRKRVGISQEELGSRSRLHRTEVGLLERGERIPRIDTLLKLATGLDVRVDSPLLEGIVWEAGTTTTTPGAFAFSTRSDVRERAAAFRASQAEEDDAAQLARESREELEARTDQVLREDCPEQDRPLWATAFYAGLRHGGLQALRVCDLDFEVDLILIERGWDQVEGAIEPKSRAGWRSVPMLALLRKHLEAHSGRSGRRGREAELAAKDGRDPDLLRPIGLHMCHHTFASLLIDSGANPKPIQEFMGHSKIHTTFGVYGHLLPGSHDAVRARMDAYLRGDEDREPDA